MTHPFNLSPSALGFALVVDGQPVDWTDAGFALERERTEPRAGKSGASAIEHIREWRHAARNLLIEQHLILHSDLPMAAQLGEAWIVVRNVSTKAVTISRIDSATLQLPAHADELLYFTSSWGLEFESIREKLAGPKVLETRAGRSSQGQHPWFALFGQDFVFSAAPAWSGN